MKKRYHTLIIGSGCAGYNAADKLFDLGIKDIAIITEGRYMGTSRNTGSDKQTYYKLSLCGSDGDSVREMANTLYSGGGVMGEHALCEAAYSTRCFMRLVELGVPFPTNEYGEYAGYKTDHDPRSRATSCGPLTSKYMTEALERSVLSKDIEIIDHQRAIKILTKGNTVTGVVCVDTVSGDICVIACQNVILCTGGPACVYKNTVYPESQHGATGLAIEAGTTISNMEEWQYGIASIKFRWNLSGTYQQVLPRYISVDENGVEREFLYDALGDASLGLIFLKGYQWPFDTRKIDGSSKIDILVAKEIKDGKRVFLDFLHNPKGLENGFDVLPKEAYSYLERSGALFGTPISRLEKMNLGAIELYADHGIDLRSEYLEIAVCAQHCNGGVAVDANWQSEICGLYAAGEAAGTFGVYRPGGSALNSTQVGSLRAAEHIARQKDRQIFEPEYVMPKIRYGTSNVSKIEDELQRQMSRVADFDRSTHGMKNLYEKVDKLCEEFFDTVTIKDKTQLAELFKLYDTALCVRAVLSAMIFSAQNIETHGSAMVDGSYAQNTDEARRTRTLTKNSVSYMENVSQMPDPELWFETLLARQNRRSKMKDNNYRIGLVSVSFRAHTPKEILDAMREADLHFIEWGSDVHAPCTDIEKLEEIVRLQREYGVVCSSYGTYFRVGQTPIQELDAYINAAKILGTNILRLWCGTKCSDDMTASEREYLINQCKKAAEIAREHGVVLCMECHKNTFTQRIQDTLELMQAVNSQNFQMYWQPFQWQSIEDNLAYAKEVAPYTRNIHVFQWKDKERFSLLDGISEWKMYLENFKTPKTLLLEFMPDEKISSLKTEAEALKTIVGDKT